MEPGLSETKSGASAVAKAGQEIPPRSPEKIRRARTTLIHSHNFAFRESLEWSETRSGAPRATITSAQVLDLFAQIRVHHESFDFAGAFWITGPSCSSLRDVNR